MCCEHCCFHVRLRLDRPGSLVPVQLVLLDHGPAGPWIYQSLDKGPPDSGSDRSRVRLFCWVIQLQRKHSQSECESFAFPSQNKFAPGFQSSGWLSSQPLDPLKSPVVRKNSETSAPQNKKPSQEHETMKLLFFSVKNKLIKYAGYLTERRRLWTPRRAGALNLREAETEQVLRDKSSTQCE